MTDYNNTTYHIYLKDNCIYWNLNEEEFEEKWQMLNVMVDLIASDYTEDDLSYIKLGTKCGVGGPGRIVKDSEWEEDSY
jgi:hypothetical protein